MTIDGLILQEPKRNLALIGIVAILLAISAVLATGIRIEIVPLSPLNRAVADFKATPLIELAIADNPDAEKAIRQALADDQSQPVAPGVPSRATYAIGAVSRDYIRPMLAAADDSAVIAVMAARFALAQRLRVDDPQTCRDFAMNAAQRVERFTPQGRALFNDYITKMEAAYRSGRSTKGKPMPMATPPEIVQMLGQTGFTRDDLDALNRFAALPSLRACDIDLKIDGAPPKLPPEKRAPFARFVLTH